MASWPAQANGIPKIVTSKPPAVDSESQPSAASSDVNLVPATAIEHVQTTYLNEDEWRGPLTLEQYLEREGVLQSLDLSRDGRITGWILTSETLPQNQDMSRPILSSCETYLVHGYVARDGHVKKVQAHGIASVHTRPEHRGKGYAGRMMADLGHRLETWQRPHGTNNPFSVLWSDIGTQFYAKHGWKVFPSNHIHLTPLERAGYEAARRSLPAVNDLCVADLRDIPTIDYIEQRLQRLSDSEPGITHVAIRPDLEHFQWHFGREDYIHQALGKAQPQIKGAINRDTGIALIWHRVYAANPKDWRLNILHAVVPPSVETSKDAQAVLAALLLRAQLEAHAWELAGGVEVWDPSDLVIAAAQALRKEEQGKVEVITRDKNNIPSLRWAAGGDEELRWVANEQYAWC
ncbi:hypothetical protein A1O1_02490 [Capronia coronata CBS 617.96]|uniref:N-acetyltransferase domain-containing protein n=1 Tax=Capronia coronata CBS 617.96 TaxID=1182541 RepID=W9YME2_9EURO|nr:uncharacterized protein A1O1_02490 [Capronia coronata CBS 617.96]EXJ94097.1 hypothetical protein A1O1_02490 [Capronia coronata CBS 617.96]